MLDHSGHPEVVGDGPHSDHQQVVGHQVGAGRTELTQTVDHLTVEIDPRRHRQVKVVLVGEPNVAYRLDDAAELEGADRRACQEGREQEVVAGADHDDVIELPVDVSEQAVAAPAGAEYH